MHFVIYGHEWCLKVLKIARAVGFFIYYILNKITQTRYFVRAHYSNALLCLCSCSSSFGFSFLSVALVCQTFNQVCLAFNVFLFFAFSLSCSTIFLVWQSKPTVSHFFSLWFSNLALPRCFHSNFRIALYNLFMHSPLASQKQDILLSI